MSGFLVLNIRGDTHMTSALREGGGEGGLGLRQKLVLSDVGEWGVTECSGRPIFFFIKESWIWAMIRHHANNILLTRNLRFYFDLRQWSHPLMISLHCWWTKSNNRMRGQFEYDVTVFLFCFCFDFVHLHALLFHSLFLFLRCANKTGWLQNEY